MFYIILIKSLPSLPVPIRRTALLSCASECLGVEPQHGELWHDHLFVLQPLPIDWQLSLLYIQTLRYISVRECSYGSPDSGSFGEQEEVAIAMVELNLGSRDVVVVET